MHAVLPNVDESTRLLLENQGPLDDDEFYDLCMANPDLPIERNAQGRIVIVPPAGGDSDYCNAELIMQLRIWAKNDRRGKSFGASACFLLPDGSGLSPDSAWVSFEKLAALSRATRKKFLPVVPDFVIEVLSPSDRLKRAQAKMVQWIANGVALGWLVDPEKETVYVYRAGLPVEKVTGVDKLEAGDGPVKGFVADLTEVWAGL